jgi:hypothetical protein
LNRRTGSYCPINDWLTEGSGFTIAEQFAIGFSVLAGTKPFDESLALHERSLLGSAYLPGVAQRLDKSAAQAAELLSASRDWYRARFSLGEQTTTRAAWERTAFEIRPLLRLADGRLLLISPRAIESWLGDGFYHRALGAARRRDRAESFLSFYGALIERYVLAQLHHVHPEPRPLGSGRVFGEQP